MPFLFLARDRLPVQARRFQVMTRDILWSVIQTPFGRKEKNGTMLDDVLLNLLSHMTAVGSLRKNKNKNKKRKIRKRKKLAEDEY